MAIELKPRERNVLRRLFNRTDFTPQDVAALGFARLQGAPGLGSKSLEHVLAWLDAEGCPLLPPPQRAVQQQRLHRRMEQARHLLERLGWRVVGPDTSRQD